MTRLGLLLLGLAACSSVGNTQQDDQDILLPLVYGASIDPRAMPVAFCWHNGRRSDEFRCLVYAPPVEEIEVFLIAPDRLDGLDGINSLFVLLPRSPTAGQWSWARRLARAVGKKYPDSSAHLVVGDDTYEDVRTPRELACLFTSRVDPDAPPARARLWGDNPSDLDGAARYVRSAIQPLHDRTDLTLKPLPNGNFDARVGDRAAYAAGTSPPPTREMSTDEILRYWRTVPPTPARDFEVALVPRARILLPATPGEDRDRCLALARTLAKRGQVDLYHD